MAIRMRTNKSETKKCEECKRLAENVLELYDLQIGGNVITICDECNDKIFNITLRAQTKLNGKVKSQRDMAIINKRRKREKEKW